MHLERHEYGSAGISVPLLYGKRRIGGAIISAGIYVEDQQ
jgi:predicted phage tail protein